ncbi:MAG: ABC transporter permease [Patescibacteria group bacterium]|nr:ABC transporter permease [Patescibacteria group bacterium]MDE2172368.1 ABC transporter permease [Patescibacteria group bacterium]
MDTVVKPASLVSTAGSNSLYAVYILWLRQIKRYFRSRSRIIGSLGQPILFLVALGFGLSSVFSSSGNGNYIQFLAPGIVAMSILFTAIFSGIEIIWDRQFGFLKETLVAPVSRFNIMFGRTLGGATVAIFQGILVLVISMAIGFRPDIADILPGLVFMALIALVFTALGTAIASTLEDMQGFQLIMNFVVMPVFFLSGALFPLDTAPPVLKWIAAFNPLAYGVDGLRSAFIHHSLYGAFTDGLVLALIALVFMALGAWFFSRIRA